MHKARLLDWVIAPLTLLERVKGPRRVGILLLYAVTLLVVGVSGWRVFVVWRLPDIGEPFDVVKFGTVDVPDAENAMVLYREAGKQLIAPDLTVYKVSSSKAWDNLDWGTADPEIRRWAADNGPAFALWLKATDRNKSLIVQPGDLKNQPMLVPLFSLRDFANLATLEASRLEEGGDLEGAWRIHHAVLRSSRHAGMNGPAMQRLIGHSLLVRARTEVRRWVDDPRTSPRLLRQAIDDVEVCKRMTPPASEMVRAEYFQTRSILDDSKIWSGHHFGGADGNTQWLNHITFVPEARHFLMREPERSQRVLRLITAGLLAQCDRPPATRPALASRNYLIYEVDPSSPRVFSKLTPQELEIWAGRTTIIGFNGNYHPAVMTRIDAEPGIFDTFLIHMAERAYEIEHGKPPQTYADLLGAYLRVLPEGFEPIDRVSASTNPE